MAFGPCNARAGSKSGWERRAMTTDFGKKLLEAIATLPKRVRLRRKLNPPKPKREIVKGRKYPGYEKSSWGGYGGVPQGMFEPEKGRESRGGGSIEVNRRRH